MKLISICPSNTELAVYLGLKNDLIALDDFSDWPLELNYLPKLGPDLSIDMDLLESYKPDLVLASLSVPGMEKNVKELEARNIPHIVFNPQSFSDIASDLELLGKATGKEAETRDVLKKYNHTLNTYRAISETIDQPPSVYFEWWPNPIFTPGKINWLTELSELAGAKNIFDDVELASVQTNWDDVFNRNPDHICLSWVGVKQSRMKISHVLKRVNAQDLKAVKNGHIHLLEESLFCRPSPRLLYGLQKLAFRLHPTLYPQPQENELLL
ncbi:iron complex transport system substrate-binding protein [Metabacillus crassostreae]|uniref:cobalamin-binding protein n=1 Tax=Metabacillus crassostreae TaxID=929098 RepID=UPI00195DBC09|nr:cobalamin-binding protein [Metabacillus crassostreae]MBM7605406.1 iron complex transport system substrate-binding protein [Metabacillus crassostreae]